MLSLIDYLQLICSIMIFMVNFVSMLKLGLVGVGIVFMMLFWIACFSIIFLLCTSIIFSYCLLSLYLSLFSQTPVISCLSSPNNTLAFPPTHDALKSYTKSSLLPSDSTLAYTAKTSIKLILCLYVCQFSIHLLFSYL